MGANLITGVVAVPSGHRISDEDVERAIARSLSDDMTYSQLPETIEMERVIAEWESDHQDVYLGGDDVLPESLREAVREYLRAVVDRLRGVLGESYRDVNTYEIDDFLFFIVGETTYGDNPGPDLEAVSEFWFADDAVGGRLADELGVLQPGTLAAAIKRGTTKKVYTPADPRTPEEVVRDASEMNELQGHVALNLDAVLDGDVFSIDIREVLNNSFSLAMTGSQTGLLNIAATPVGVTDGNLVVYDVRGTVSVGEFEWPAT
jgi:hypothetical protein